KENTNVDPSGTDREYLPSISVAVPIPVPGIETVAPGTGSPFSSTTVPVTVMSSVIGDRRLVLGTPSKAKTGWAEIKRLGISSWYNSLLINLLTNSCNGIFIKSFGFILDL